MKQFTLDLRTTPKVIPAPRPRMTEIEYEARKDEILSQLPKEFHGAIGWQAWERGHSAGYEEVIGCLDEMVDALVKPIKEYTERIIKASE